MIEKIMNLWQEMPINKKIMIITGEEFSLVSSDVWGKEMNEILNIKLLEKDPEKLWEWVLSKRNVIKNIKPNLQYIALAKLENFFNDNFILLTDSIDGLHLKAGNYRVIETMGNLFENKIYEHGLNNSTSVNIEKDFSFFLRPNIVLEGEDNERIKYLQTKNFAQQTNVIIVLGKKFKKNYFYDVPLLTKKSKNIKIIEISSDKQEYSDLYINTEKIDYENILPLLVNIIIDIEIGIRQEKIEL